MKSEAVSKAERRGAVILLYGILVNATVNFFLFNARSLFTIPITESLNVSFSALSLAYSISSLSIAACSSPAGKFMSRPRRDYRLMLFLSCFVCGLLTALVGSVQRIWQLYVLFALRAFPITVALYLSFPVLMGRFLPKYRNLSNSLILMGASLGGILLPDMINRLIESLGWRLTFQLAGAVMAVIVAPLSFLAVRNAPEGEAAPEAGADGATEASGAREALSQPSAEEAETESSAAPPAAPAKGSLLKDKRFLTMAAALGVSYFIGVILYHLSPLMQSMGGSASFAAKMLMLQSLAALVSKLLIGRVFDRVSLRAGMTACCIGVILTYAFAILGCLLKHSLLIVLTALSYGVGIVCFGTTITPVIYACYPLERYNEVAGKVTAVTNLAIIAGDQLMSFCHDLFGSYLPILCLYCLLAIVNLLQFLRLCKGLQQDRKSQTAAADTEQ